MLRTLTLAGSWLALPDLQASRVDLLNNTGGDVSVRFVHDSGHAITLKDGQSVALPVQNLRAATVELNGTGDVACVFVP